jgi:hypothetical protein
MYLCACWIAVACDRWFNKHTNTWPIKGHDSISRQMHDPSQATTIQQAHKHMTDQRQQRFNKHTNTWPITGNNDSTSTQIHIVVACDWSCICLLAESLPVIGHVFVCLLNCCWLWSVMYLCVFWIFVTCYRSLTGHNDSTSRKIHDRSQATTIQQAHKYMTDHRPQRFNKHTNTWPITGHNDL